MLKNPEIRRVNRAYLYQLGFDGSFEHSGSAAEDDHARLESVELIQMDACLEDVAMWVHQFETATFATSTGPLSFRTLDTERFFMKTHLPSDRLPSSVFTSVDTLMTNPATRTELLFDLIKYIPADELASYGAAALKSLIK